MRTCKKCDIPLHIRTIWKGKHPGGGRFSCKIRRKWTVPAPADHHRHHMNTPRTATRGRFTNRKGKAFSPCYATLLPAPMFPTPAHQSAFLKQVTGKLGVGGVVLKPGRKNETVKRSRSKNKNFGGRKRHICEGKVRPLCGGGAMVAAWC